MNVKTYFRTKKHMTNCCKNCATCQLGIMNNSKHVSCTVLELDYPEVAEEIVKKYIDKTFPNGYVVCIQSGKIEDISKCNKFESCTECLNN